MPAQKNYNKIQWDFKEATGDEDYIRALVNGSWFIKEKRVLKSCTKTRYYCKNSRAAGCPALLRVEKLNIGGYIIFSALTHGNECVNILAQTPVKEIVLGLYKQGITRPWEIEKRLSGMGAQMESKRIYSILNNYKRKFSVPAKITYDVLKEFCASLCFQGNENASYVASYTVERKRVRILLTNKKLVLHLPEARNFHVDATYKLVDVGYPIIVFGITDNNQMFVLIALAVMSEETADDYFWVFESISNEVRGLGFELVLHNLVADSAMQISNALQRFSPECLRLHCWAHVWRNIEMHLKTIPGGLKRIFDK